MPYFYNFVLFVVYIYLVQYKLILIPCVVACIIQTCKIFVDIFLYQRPWNIKNLRVAGGFPSVHSGLSGSLVTVMGYIYGLESAHFALALCFAILFWYDAANVRYQAGQHAQYINYLTKLLHQLEKVGIHEKHLAHLKERLGHTVYEVLGGIFSSVFLTLVILQWM